MVPITFDGRYLGELYVRPGTDEALVARAVEQLAALTAWTRLGASLAALGPYRVELAARVAAAAAGGGRGIGAEEADGIARWFAGVVDEAISRGGLRAGAAIWIVLAGDSHADPVEARAPRCPAVAAVPYPPRSLATEPGGAAPHLAEAAAFLAGLRAAAAGYVHTAVAGASAADVLELREIARADDDALEDYRPWGIDLADGAAPSEALADARSLLTCRHLSNDEACSGFAEWAQGFAGRVVEHELPPVLRIGAVAWLARVALRLERGAA